ncbi:hypothetical protein E3P84_03400 [Wallemia ichthyophaga]|nr:hypothetical protein E3P84_03400 [Wallemia ichthyophaga]TIB39739.1 hypothetical protein E3P83_03300 [Wallemia ichthyophaga]
MIIFSLSMADVESDHSEDSLFDGSELLDTCTHLQNLPIVHQFPPINIPGLHLDQEAISPETQSQILSQLSFDPPSVTQHVIFGTLPPFLGCLVEQLRVRAQSYICLNTHTKLFNQVDNRQCIINVYGYNESPSAYYLPQHTDLECFGEGVIILSLGSSIAMKFESLADGANDSFELLLRPGSVLYLTDDARYRWTHGIAPRTVDNVHNVGLLQRGVRVGVTLRYYNE